MKCEICGEPSTAVIIGKETKGFCKLHMAEVKEKWRHESELRRIEVNDWIEKLQLKYGEKHA